MVKRYIVNFPEMMRLCEMNFAQLRRLLPDKDNVGEAVIYQINSISYSVTILELTRYTTLVKIEQHPPTVDYWKLPSMSVRLYYDVMTAEVCSVQQINHFKACYDYPNKKLLQHDEKYQINLFLADWLRCCFSCDAWVVTAY